jgi:hypothetical protein
MVGDPTKQVQVSFPAGGDDNWRAAIALQVVGKLVDRAPMHRLVAIDREDLMGHIDAECLAALDRVIDRGPAGVLVALSDEHSAIPVRDGDGERPNGRSFVRIGPPNRHMLIAAERPESLSVTSLGVDWFVSLA